MLAPSENDTGKESIIQQPLLPLIDQQLSKNCTDSQLFIDCNVFLVGFDDQGAAKAKLGRLLRRGMAAICWSLNDDTTHVIVADGLEENVR